jgi:hypothetical protein
MIIARTIAQTVNFTESTTDGIFNVSPSLQLTQSVDVHGTRHFTIRDTIHGRLDLNSLATYINADGTIKEYLGPTHSVFLDRSIVNLSINHVLILTHDTDRGTYTDASNTLSLSDILSVLASRPSTTTLVLSQTVTCSRFGTRTASNTLSITACAVVPIAPACVEVYHRNSVIFSYGTLSIELRNPELGNSEQFEWNRINKRSRGNELIIYRDSNWPKARKFVYNFSALTEIKKQQLLLFLSETIGQKINLLDYEGRSWDGIITTPNTQFNEQVTDSDSVTIQFEVVS